jgi:two-component sensor histidine kinase
MLLEIVPAQTSPAIDLAAEANHRIANHISLVAGLVRMQGSALRNQSPKINGNQALLILEEVSARLETVGRLHRLLARAPDGASIDLTDYLRDIARGAVSCLSLAGEIQLCFVAESRWLIPSEKALRVGLIVGEIITNAVKYAHPTGIVGQIRFTCRGRSHETLTIEISDDGVGLPEGLDPNTSASLGFKLVRMLANQLGAAVAFDSNALGLDFTLQIPAG